MPLIPEMSEHGDTQIPGSQTELGVLPHLITTLADDRIPGSQTDPGVLSHLIAAETG